PGERQRRGARLARAERVDEDPPALAVDEAQVGEVVAAHLVDTGYDLEEAVDAVQLRLAPEARVDARRRVARDERVAPRVPDRPSVRPWDDDVAVARDEAAPGILEVLWIVEWERLRDRGVGRRGDGCRRGVA